MPRFYNCGPFTSCRCASRRKAEHIAAQHALFANWPAEVAGAKALHRKQRVEEAARKLSAQAPELRKVPPYVYSNSTLERFF